MTAIYETMLRNERHRSSYSTGIRWAGTGAVATRDFSEGELVADLRPTTVASGPVQGASEVDVAYAASLTVPKFSKWLPLCSPCSTVEEAAKRCRYGRSFYPLLTFFDVDSEPEPNVTVYLYEGDEETFCAAAIFTDRAILKNEVMCARFVPIEDILVIQRLGKLAAARRNRDRWIAVEIATKIEESSNTVVTSGEDVCRAIENSGYPAPVMEWLKTVEMEVREGVRKTPVIDYILYSEATSRREARKAMGLDVFEEKLLKAVRDTQ